MPDKKYKPGQLTDDEQCANCGDPVSIDNQGRVLCYACAKFVQAVSVQDVKTTKHRKYTQHKLMKDWGLPE